MPLSFSARVLAVGAVFLLTTGLAPVSAAPSTTVRHSTQIAVEYSDAVAEVNSDAAADSMSVASVERLTRLVGYMPRARNGMMVNPAGGCSSPVPLPAEFDVPCKAHDLGYDLLRSAGATAQPLEPRVRVDLDAQLSRRLHRSCADRNGFVPRWSCQAMAAVATVFVEINSWRQHDGVPVRESPVPYFMGIGLLASILLRRSLRSLVSTFRLPALLPTPNGMTR